MIITEEELCTAAQSRCAMQVPEMRQKFGRQAKTLSDENRDELTSGHDKFGDVGCTEQKIASREAQE